MLTRVLSLLPSPHVDESLIARIEAVVPQCNLSDLNTIAHAIGKWIRNDASYRHSTPSKFVRLLQALNRCGHERLQTAERLDLLLEELKYVSGEWFEEMLLEDTILTLNRMIDQINWTNVPELSLFLTRINHLSPSLMDRIADVVIEYLDKVIKSLKKIVLNVNAPIPELTSFLLKFHYSATYATLLPFSVLNYETVKIEEMYDACIQHFTPHISKSVNYFYTVTVLLD